LSGHAKFTFIPYPNEQFFFLIVCIIHGDYLTKTKLKKTIEIENLFRILFQILSENAMSQTESFVFSS